MTEDDLRALMRKKFEAMTMNEWCRLTGVNKSHVGEFLHKKRGPPHDMLRALNMRIDYVKVRNTRQALGGEHE